MAILLVAICAFVGFYSIEYSVISFIIVSYAIWLIMQLVNFFTRPSKVLPFCQSLSVQEVKAYQTYHFYLLRPAASELMLSMLNALRVTGLMWCVIAIWVGLYWQAGMCMVYFLITADLIKKLSPWLKMGAKAEKGNIIARKQLYLVDLVQIKMNKFNQGRHE